MTTIELLPYIAEANPHITAFTCHHYPRQMMVQNQFDEWTEAEQQMFDFAVQMREQYHLPFWDGIMLSSFDNPQFSERVIMQALRHNPVPELITLSVSNLSSLGHMPLDNFALCSKVILSDVGSLHLPMLDFHISASKVNSLVAADVCGILGLGHGWLISSGESYHFIGSKPMLWEELQIKLLQAMLFTPIIDKAWLSHQLREQCCSLRIGLKNGIMPKVYKEL